MTLITLRQLLDHAAEHEYGVPAFNANNLEQVRAIMEAADATGSPVIVQAAVIAARDAWRDFVRLRDTPIGVPPAEESKMHQVGGNNSLSSQL